MRRRPVFRLATTITAILILASVEVPMSIAASEDAPTTPSCHTPTRTTYINESGTTVEEGAPGAATVYWFGTLGDGRMIVPPADFRFDKASNEQLEAWGYPPRDAEAGTDWTTEDGILAPQVHKSAPSICTYPEVRASDSAAAPWSGVVAQASTNDLRRVYGTARVPTFSSACTGTTAVAFWVGIGGYGNSYLIQNGWVTDNGSPQGMFPWFEFVGSDNSGIDLARVPGVGQTGDLVKSDTYYNSGTDPDQVQFNWTDTTTGTALTPYVTSLVDGDDGHTHGVHDYYKGSSAEVVDEQLGTTKVRSFSTAGWKDMYAARASHAAAAIGTFTYDTVYVPGTPQKVLSVFGAALVSTTAMNIKWGQCT